MSATSASKKRSFDEVSKSVVCSASALFHPDYGYCTKKLFEDPKALQDAFDASIENQRDLPELTNCLKYGAVGGGFAALGNPESQHDDFPRAVRRAAYEKIREIILEVRPELANEKNVELLVDRMLLRPPQVLPTAESWHRDLSPLDGDKVRALSDDMIFGGWVNCNADVDQYFVCVPGSYKTGSESMIGGSGSLGFRLLTKDEMK